jgi:hypothetical protein
MKRIIWITLLSAFALSSFGQKAVDSIFNDYSGRKGYVTVNVSGGLLKFAAMLDREDEDLNTLAACITRIRILALEDDNGTDPGFYNRVMDQLDRSVYEEMMDITSSGTRAKVLVKADGDTFSEFLMVVGGDDNALIQIKGKMTTEDIQKLSADMGSDKSIVRYR